MKGRLPECCHRTYPTFCGVCTLSLLPNPTVVPLSLPVMS